MEPGTHPAAASEPAGARHVAVLGAGLLGGSVLLAARRHLPGVTLSAWSHGEGERRAVQDRGLADLASLDLAGIVNGADLVILCTPPAAIPSLGRALLPHLAPAAVVTDVGSVKMPVVKELGPLFTGRFVGGHPMAGKERGGLEAAEADLFAGATCLLTPDEHTAPGTLARVAAFWETLGCRDVRTLSAAEHDRAVALVSHLPHLLAGALLTLADPDALACSGPGFRDMTRPAAGPAELWTEILSLNRAALTSALLAMTDQLHDLAALLKPGREMDLAAFLRAAAGRRAGRFPHPGEAPPA